jgi:hypothetical protein
MSQECRTCAKVVASARANFCPNCGTVLRPAAAVAGIPQRGGTWIAWVFILVSAVTSFVALVGLSSK